MKFKSLHVDQVLSFVDFDFPFGDGLHTIIGPNSVGKSNIASIIQFIVSGVKWASKQIGNDMESVHLSQVMESYAAARHYHSKDNMPSRIRLEVEFTSNDEKRVLNTFVQSALLSTLMKNSTLKSDQLFRLNEWIEVEVTGESLTSLYSGVLTFEHIGNPQRPWKISYDFGHEGQLYSWLVYSYGGISGIVNADSSDPYTSSIDGLLNRIFGISSSQNELPAKLPMFDLNCLCPVSSTATDEIMLDAFIAGQHTELTVFRKAVEIFQFRSITTSNSSPLKLANVLTLIIDDNVVILGQQLRGLGAAINPGPYSWRQLTFQRRSPEPWLLPQRLFLLKNGNVEQRRMYQEIQEKFIRLAVVSGLDIQFKVVEPGIQMYGLIGNMQQSFRMTTEETDENTFESEPSFDLTIVVKKDNCSEGYIPIERLGAGIWDLLVLVEALVNSDERIVILDEPALGLHPSMQRKLCTFLKDTKGTVIMITHSANLVPVSNQDDIKRLFRFDNKNGETSINRIDLGEDCSKSILRMVKELSGSSDAVSLLFASGVVLLEGETELGALPKWFEDISHCVEAPNTAKLDIAYFSVNGDLSFKTFITLLNSFSIPWVVVCDGAIFDLKNHQNNNIFNQMLCAGVENEELKNILKKYNTGDSSFQMTEEIFGHLKAVGRKNNIFTLASGWETGKESFEDFDGFKDKLIEAKEECGKSKVRQGRWIAENIPPPESVKDLFYNIMTAFEK